MICVIFTGAFCYSFASLGNLGLITREAVVTMPFFLVVLCVPRGPHHRPPRYFWELRRRERVRAQESDGPSRRCERTRDSGSRLILYHLPQGSPPSVRHEV